MPTASEADDDVITHSQPGDVRRHRFDDSGAFMSKNYRHGQRDQLLHHRQVRMARGATITLSNQLMGYAPEFKALLYNTFRGKYFALELNDCTASEISLPPSRKIFGSWI